MTDKSNTTYHVIKRGFFNQCPQCGGGKLLHKYITPHKNCAQCHLDFAPLRADDGPAWATILITGHLVMPFAFWMLEYENLSTNFIIAALIAIVIAMSIVILPRAKGIFMAIIWMTQEAKEPPAQNSEIN